VIAVAALATSRLGLGMRAIREDEEAAESSGVGALSLKLTALALSTALAGSRAALRLLPISYYPSHPFGPHWTFDALLMTYIGGVAARSGTGARRRPLRRAQGISRVRWVDIHLLIFGALFVPSCCCCPAAW